MEIIKIHEVVPEKKEKTSGLTVKGFLKNSYIRFVLKKLVFYAVVFVIAITIAWLLPRMLPGDPLLAYVNPGGNIEAQEAYKQEYYHTFGLDKPIYEQYLIFWYNLFFYVGPDKYGNVGYQPLFLGRTFTPGDPRSVTEIVMIYLPYTLVLIVPVVILAFIIGNWVGSRIGFHKNKMNTFAYYVLIFFSSAPFFWLSLVILDIFVLRFGILKYGQKIPTNFAPDSILIAINNYTLPFLTLLLSGIGGWATGMRSMTVYELDADYILYGKKLGFHKSKLRGYTARNALLPQLTGLNLAFNGAIGNTLILEIVFDWPGLGLLQFESFTSSNYPMIIGTFVITIIVVLIGNFLIDILYGVIDPRIRAGGK